MKNVKIKYFTTKRKTIFWRVSDAGSGQSNIEIEFLRINQKIWIESMRSSVQKLLALEQCYEIAEEELALIL